MVICISKYISLNLIFLICYRISLNFRISLKLALYKSRIKTKIFAKHVSFRDARSKVRVNNDVPYSSDEGDTITVIIYIDDERKELGEYCGQKKPPVLMSNGVKMEVVFKSDSKMKSGVSGFKFEYKFRTGWLNAPIN